MLCKFSFSLKMETESTHLETDMTSHHQRDNIKYQIVRICKFEVDSFFVLYVRTSGGPRIEP
jgi:hypothetical protein